MKLIFHILAFLLAFGVYSQQSVDTLKQEVIGLGSEKIILFSDHTFKFESYLCGFQFYSYGTYRQRFGNLHFYSDSTKCPFPEIQIIKSENAVEHIKVIFLNSTDSTQLKYGPDIQIKTWIISMDSNEVSILKSDLINGELRIFIKNPYLTFKVDSLSKEIIVYLNPDFFSYECSDCPYKRLKRTKWGFRHTHIEYIENENKPWKKGKKVKRHYYFISTKSKS